MTQDPLNLFPPRHFVSTARSSVRVNLKNAFLGFGRQCHVTAQGSYSARDVELFENPRQFHVTVQTDQ